jgi:TRAP-type C4-dicarboxylate transport system permease small subunit
MKTLSNIVAWVSRVLHSVAGIALTAIVVLTGADVVLRYFGRPIVGTYEIVALLGALVAGFALPQTQRVQGHVLMDFIITRLPSGLQKLLYVITRLLGIFVFGLIGREVWLLGDGYRRLGEGSLTLANPLFPLAYVIAACSFVVIVVLFLEIVEGKKEEAEQ